MSDKDGAATARHWLVGRARCRRCSAPAAVGHVVIAVASLEKALQLEVSRLLMARAATDAARFETSLANDLTALDNMTAGRLLSRLRDLGVPDELDQRIGAVIDRRNDLIHHTFEDATLVAALEGGRAIDEAVSMLEQLVIDAGELAVELHLFAMPKLEAMTGMSLEAMAEVIRTIDPTSSLTIAAGRNSKRPRRSSQ